MEFVANFVEIIFMIALLLALVFGLLYVMRHRARASRWINNFASEENAEEKEGRVRTLKRKIEDAT